MNVQVAAVHIILANTISYFFDQIVINYILAKQLSIPYAGCKFSLQLQNSERTSMVLRSELYSATLISLMPVIRYRTIVDKSFHCLLEWAICQKRFEAIQAKRENGREDLHVIRTSFLIEPLFDPCTSRPESMQIVSLLHQGQRSGGVDLRRREPPGCRPFLPGDLWSSAPSWCRGGRSSGLGRAAIWPGWIYLRACKVPWPLKAANRGHTDIKLRERGTKKLHVFTGERVQVDKPKCAPARMGDKIWKPVVKKVGVETLDEL